MSVDIHSTKTNAFFASPFSSSPPPTPTLPPPATRSSSSSTSSLSPSPTTSRSNSFYEQPRSFKQQLPTLDCIFPSRYTSLTDSDDDFSRLPHPAPGHHHFAFSPNYFPSTPSSPTSTTSHSSAPPDTTPRQPPFLPKTVALTSGTILSSPSPPPSPNPFSSNSIQDPAHTFSPSPQSTTLSLIRTLGHGAFSSVWLATDLSDPPLAPFQPSRSNSVRSKSSNPNSPANSHFPSRRGRRQRRTTVTPARVHGTRPFPSYFSPDGAKGLSRADSTGSARSVYLSERDGDGATSHQDLDPSFDLESHLPYAANTGRLVAVKLTPRAAPHDLDDRTRVSFIREVEILRHISHPNIVPHLASFTSHTHDVHVLVLEHLAGGELFDLVNADAAHACLGERTLRRIWRELCAAVAWMHGVGLVHRDIKLENILLTRPFPFPATARRPLIKLTDFGLARFISPAAPLLRTRCGSEAYIAPELVISGGRAAVASAGVVRGFERGAGPTSFGVDDATDAGGGGVKGWAYDARETDAWACGVVLYALATRRMPFGGVALEREGAGLATGRRKCLMRIAKGEYEWPAAPSPVTATATRPGLGAGADTWTGVGVGVDGDVDNVFMNARSSAEELFGVDLSLSAGVRRVVGRLLVRDPSRRARISDLWGEPWMQENGHGVADIVGRDSLGGRGGGSGGDKAEEERVRERADSTWGQNGHEVDEDEREDFFEDESGDGDSSYLSSQYARGFGGLGSGYGSFGHGYGYDDGDGDGSQNGGEREEEGEEEEGEIVDWEGIGRIACEEVQ